MLRKIIAIKNTGRFRNSAAQPNPAFGKHTLIFAPNGYGKSTLAAVLRSLQLGDGAIVLGRQTLGVAGTPEIDLLLEGRTRKFRNGTWDGPEAKVSIFDGTFIAENIHSGDVIDINHRRRLYRIIVGGAGVALAEKEALLADEARRKQTELTAAERAVQILLPRGMQLSDFLALAPDPTIDAQIEAVIRNVEAVKQAAPIHARAPLTAVQVPMLAEGLQHLLGKTLEGIDNDAQQRVRDHLDLHKMERNGRAWLEEGLRHAEDGCPFCGRTGLDALDLVKAYRALFSEGYRQLQVSVAEAIAQATGEFGDRAIGNIRTRLAQNEANAEFWGRYVEAPAPDSIDEVVTAIAELGDDLINLLARKSRSLLEVVAVEDIRTLELRFEPLQKALLAHNEAIKTINEAIAAKKAATAAADLRTEEARVARFEALKRRQEPAVSAECDRCMQLGTEKKELERQKADVRGQLENHAQQVVQPYEKRINYFLGRFNADFKIVQTGHAYPGGAAASSYQLAIDNVAVDLGDGNTPANRPSFKNTLSAGDKATLALAFFLASIEREPDLAERLIVFDDPFSSQDSFRRRQTIFEILNIASTAAQTIVLSHDNVFLKQLWEKLVPADRVALQVSHHPASGSKISEFDLENACRGRAQAELDDLMAYRAAGAGSPREIIKKLRIVLETYFRTTYPAAFDHNDSYGGILAKIRNGGAQHPAQEHYATLDRINDYTAEYHHGEDPRGAAEPQLDERELHGFVEDTLKLVNALPS